MADPINTIYIEEIDSDDEGPPTPPQDGRHLPPSDDDTEEMFIESGVAPDGVCSLLDPGCMVQSKAPEMNGTKMAWRHMGLTNEHRPLPRGGHAACQCLSEGNTMILFGGADRAPQPYNDTFILDVTQLSWTPTEAACPPAPRSGHTLAVVGGVKAYVFGGQDYTSGTLLNDLHMLDLTSSPLTWVKVEPAEESGPAPRARTSHCCQAIGQNLIVFGGNSEEAGLLNDVQVFDTESRIWTAVECSHLAPEPREMAGSGVVGTNMYIVGGSGATGPLACTAVLDTAVMQWVEHTIEPVECRMAAAAGVIGSCLYVFGGVTAGGLSDQLLCLDTERQQWTRVNCKGPSARFAHTMVGLANGLVLFGGIDAEKDMNDAHIVEMTE